MLAMLERLDWSILFFIQNNLVTPINNKIMLFFTSLGDMGIVWIILAIFFIIKKNYRKLGVMLLIALMLELLVGNVILKNIFQRPRPCWIDHSFKLLVARPRDYSFPSAHAFSSFICATVIAKYNKKWGIGALILAFLISFSRLYLFVHFPSDVFVGALLGVVLGIAVYNIFNEIYNKRHLSS